MGKIKTYKAQRGFQKSEVEVLVRNPSGKERRVLLAEVENIKADRRRKKRHSYVTLSSISKNPRLDLTYNIHTNKLSLIGRQGFHTFYAILDEETLTKLLASLSIIISRSRCTLSKKLEDVITENNLPVKWFEQQFEKKIQNKEGKIHRSNRRKNLRGLKFGRRKREEISKT